MKIFIDKLATVCNYFFRKIEMWIKKENLMLGFTNLTRLQFLTEIFYEN